MSSTEDIQRLVQQCHEFSSKDQDRLKQKYAELEEQWHLLSDQITFFKGRLIEITGTNAANEFKLKRQIKNAETERQDIETQMALIQDRYNEELAQLQLEEMLLTGKQAPKTIPITGYENIKYLGEGGFSVVYEAIDKETAEKKAIKVPKRDLSLSDVDSLEELKEYSGIVPIEKQIEYGRGEKKRTLLVMPYAGETLRNYIREKKIQHHEFDKIVCWMTDILKTLIFAHEKGIIHRDIKPSNILVDDDKTLRIADFGIAQKIEHAEFNKSTNVRGTWNYIAPEQLRGVITPQNDVYSWGIVFLELLTGRTSISRRRRPSSYNPDIRIAFDEIIERCIDQDLEERYQTAQEVLIEIEEHTRFPADKIMHGIELMEVPGGRFEMGDLWGDGNKNERPVHTVELDGFYMGKYQVTNAQYAQFLNEYGSDRVKEGEYEEEKMIDEHGWGVQHENGQWQPAIGYENYPVVYVSWYGAYEFCRYYGFQLPTEAQWEYAARSGGKKEKWAGTSDKSCLTNYAWHAKNSGSRTHSVGGKKPNGLGLYDMSGNVWEWCQDWYDNEYYRELSNKVSKNPVNTNESSARVLRGGSWYYSPRLCRVAYRGRDNPGFRLNFNGFRVVCFVAVSKTP